MPLPKVRPDLFCQEVSEGCVLYDSKGRKVFVLNPTAAYVWNCCDGEHDVEAMVDELARALEKNAPTRVRLKSDVEKALSDFRTNGLLA